jgi:hypothetical protein
MQTERDMLDPDFKYIEDRAPLYSIEVGMGSVYVEVVRNFHESYEWVIRVDGEGIVEHSDCGHGIASMALRDGLIAYYGLPKKPIEVTPRW